MKYFRIFVFLLTVTAIAAAVGAFFYAERNLKALDKALSDVRQNTETAYSNWENEKQKNTFCNENSQQCYKVSEQYAELLDNWALQTEHILNARKQKPIFKYYLRMKELDKEHVPDLNSNGLASLISVCAALFFVFSIFYLLSGRGKKTSRVEVKIDRPFRRSEPEFQQRAVTTTFPTVPVGTGATAKTAVVTSQPDINILLRRATECSESEPMQAISYLEQAIEESLSTKLSLTALLLCGSLRLKNNIGESQGREQLQKVISASPQSPEAQKAQTMLETFI